jgi:cobalamin biosynthesis Mg chelatase CobN
MSFRGLSVQPTRTSRFAFNSPSSLLDSEDSPLDRYFQLSTEIKRGLTDFHTAFDSLRKKHKACLRPTFTDTADSIIEIESLTSGINTRMQTVQSHIDFRTAPSDFSADRAAIIRNLKSAVTENFRDFSTKFGLEQQSFSATFSKSAAAKDTKRRTNDDFDFFSGSDQRRLELERQRNQEEIDQIAHRAEDIRDICIGQSLENAAAAHQEVEQAASYQRKSRMWICVVILIVLILLLLLVALCK